MNNMFNRIDNITPIKFLEWLCNKWANYCTPPNFTVYVLGRSICDEQRKKIVTFLTDWYIIGLLGAFIYFLFMNYEFACCYIPGLLLLPCLLLFRFIDMGLFYLYDLGQPSETFVSGFRSIIIALLNYAQIIFMFALIYVRYGLNSWDALEISLFTMATLTLYDPSICVPSIPKWVLSSQAIIGILFIAIVVAKIMTVVAGKKDKPQADISI